MYKKILMCSLTTVLILAFSGVALANGQLQESYSVQPRFTYIRYAVANLQISSSGNSTCSTSISTCGSVDNVSITGYLEYYDNGWKRVQRWSTSSSGSCTLSKTCNVKKGFRYRFKAYYYVRKGLKTESATRVAYKDYK
jgi:hypothetical protein